MATLYIITDGTNSKIGIAKSLEKRLSAYNTHNPTFSVHRTFELSEGEARKIEGMIKLYFRDHVVGNGREWFSVPATHLEQATKGILALTGIKHAEVQCAAPGAHDVPLTAEASELLNKLISNMRVKDKTLRDKKHYETQRNLQEKLMETFAKTFNLGLSAHQLPDSVIQRDGFTFDQFYCDMESDEVCEAVRRDRVRVGDHQHNFYHLAPINTGKHVALCTGAVAMPYNYEFAPDKIKGLMARAEALGLNAFFHHQWSWHNPQDPEDNPEEIGYTGLILYTHKTPVAERLRLWEGSLRKWTIERSNVLRQRFGGNETICNVIEDVCRIDSFPLDVDSVDELFTDHLELYLAMPYSKESLGPEDWEPLFEAWHEFQATHPVDAGPNL